MRPSPGAWVCVLLGYRPPAVRFCDDDIEAQADGRWALEGYEPGVHDEEGAMFCVLSPDHRHLPNDEILDEYAGKSNKLG